MCTSLVLPLNLLLLARDVAKNKTEQNKTFNVQKQFLNKIAFLFVSVTKRHVSGSAVTRTFDTDGLI